MRALVIGTRGSALAMWQAEHICDTLSRLHPAMAIELSVIRTKGDRVQDTALHRMLDKGLFTREIENALLDGSADLAVHSLKDLPTTLPDGLMLAAVPPREDPADALVSRDGASLDDLPRAAAVLTGSLRRRAQVLHRRPDLKVLPIRGNVPTRIRKLHESDAAATILARAGLVRLDLADDTQHRLEPAEFLPACGQGALAIEIRRDDAELAELLGSIEHAPTRRAVGAERAFLAELGGGCQGLVGAYARHDDASQELTVTGMVASLDGSRLLRQTICGPAADSGAAEALGRSLAETLGDKSAVLLRAHGFTTVGPNLQAAVFRAFFTEVNARVQLQTTALGGAVAALDSEEGRLADEINLATHGRAWELWKRRVTP